MAAELTFGEVRRMIITTLEQAADTLRRLPIPRNGRPARERSAWPATLFDPCGDPGCSSSRPPIIPPAARAISELDRVLPWLAGLDNVERRLVWGRAAGLAWPRLAREFGLTVGRARYRWDVAIDRVVAAAVQDAISPRPEASTLRGACQRHSVAR